MLAAERLFALNGIDGVSLRRIGTEAGMGMNNVVQYHFGSKDGLIQAVLVNRSEVLAARRALAGQRAPKDNLHAVVEAHLLPVMELGEDPDCYYLMFLEHLMRHGIGIHPFDQLPAAQQASQRHYLRHVGRLLTSVPPPLRALRINRASAMCLHTCADRQRARMFGSAIEPYGLHVSQLLDGVEAFLSAPPSAETIEALRRSGRRPTPLVAVP